MAVPLINSLRAPSMRTRHWKELMSLTGKDFVVPDHNPDFQLRDLLDLELNLYVAAVEEITDKAAREAKQEEQLEVLEQTWSNISFEMTPYKETDVPLLRMRDDDVEVLEADQLTVQGMVASRYTHFKAESTAWKVALSTVSDVMALLSEIQRMWSYLEPLYVGSPEVRKELPADAKVFEGVDSQIKSALARMWDLKNVKEACCLPGILQVRVLPQLHY